MVNFKGRNFLSPVVKLTPQSDGLLVRADCDANPEVWAEFWFPRSEIVRLLEAVDNQLLIELAEVAALQPIFTPEAAEGHLDQK